MDLTSLIQAVPELALLFGVIGAIAWFRKQDRESRSADMAAVRNELAAVRMSQLPPDAIDPDASGRTRALGGAYRSVDPPFERIEEKLVALGSSMGELEGLVGEEIKESRRFREQTASRVTALETDVRWLRRGGKPHGDTVDDRKG